MQFGYISGSSLLVFHVPDHRDLTSERASRHLVLLVDGTWVSASNKLASERQSNLYRLNQYFDTHNRNGEAQITFYVPGLGSPSKGNRYFGGAFAFGIERDIEQVYVNISSNFKFSDAGVQDKIYLFGFSRGALVVRVVAALISRYGVLTGRNVEQYRYLWDDYIGARKIDNLDLFVSNYCINNAVVQFLGCFDTVLGAHVSRHSKALRRAFFRNFELPKSVRNAVHILAMHERRAFFRPVLWEKAALETQYLVDRV